MGITQEIAARLKRQREMRNLSQQALAAELGVASNTVSRWETGTSTPRIDELERVASALGLKIGELIPRSRTTARPEIDRLVDSLETLSEEDLREVASYAEFRRLNKALS